MQQNCTERRQLHRSFSTNHELDKEMHITSATSRSKMNSASKMRRLQSSTTAVSDFHYEKTLHFLGGKTIAGIEVYRPAGS
jgi:hypothetical protein